MSMGLDGRFKLWSLSARRAWIEITQRRDFKALGLPSLSARRAWIEIEEQTEQESNVEVALRKESVDRNMDHHVGVKLAVKSLSARRAWIEIVIGPLMFRVQPRSLSARRAWIEMFSAKYAL